MRRLQTHQRGAGRPGVLRAVLRSPLGATAAIALLLIIIVSTAAPWIAPHDPNLVRIELIDAPPGGEYIMGGDGAGRDILSRLLVAGRSTLLGALIAVVVAATIGIASGLIAGYAEGVWDTTTGWVADAVMALPAMIVILALFRSLGSSMFLAMATFGVMLAPGMHRLVRALVVRVKREPYVDAARISGLSDARIVWRHILLLIRAPVLVQLSIVASVAVLLQSGLEFLGLGDARVPSWGGMLSLAFASLYTAPQASVWPGMMITITVVCFVLVGNAVRDGMQWTNARDRGGRTMKHQDAVEAVSERPGMRDALLCVQDLRVGYERGGAIAQVVDGVSLEVHRGEILGLVGESGSGKTQTAYAILDLLGSGGSILGGRILFDGTDTTRLEPPMRRSLRGGRIGYIPQEPMRNLDPSFRIGFQLVEPLRAVRHLTKTQARTTTLGLLARVGFDDPQRIFDSYPHELSGGMAQRVLSAGAIACGPDLLIADEPTSALDVTVQGEILDLLRELQRERGMGMILVTHDLGVVADICDRVAVMHSGRIVETAGVAELFAAPKHPHTRMLLDSALEISTPRTFVTPERGAE